jgi:Ca2+-binding RTX toxin-like protein
MAIITGTNVGDPDLHGTDLADRIYGLGGDDALVGLRGDDLLEGGAGAD